MSFDPFAPGSELPPDYGPAPSMPNDAAAVARERVQAPAMALIVVGVVNLLFMLFQGGKTALDALKTPQQLEQEQAQLLDQVDKSIPGFRKAYEQSQQGKNAEDFRSQVILTGAIVIGLGVLTGLLTLIGGIRMRSLRSYGLSIAGAISAALPCITCSGTCCFGEFIGIWALIILMNGEVRAAFQ